MKLAQYIKTVFSNIWFGMLGLILHRDSHIVLFGSWMGLRFADNSRFLFQYLSKNKEALHLKRVIWVTRDSNINTMLNKMNYESYLCGTKASKYWHLKSDIHVVCNSMNRFGHDADIDIQYSFGAKRVQLWHGVGMKAVGASANSHMSSSFMKKLKTNRFIHKLITEGGWGEPFFLSPSPTQQTINQACCECSRRGMFITNYPRNCECLELLSEEKAVIDEIKKYRGIILYLPTFRDEEGAYTHPLEEESIKSFLVKNNYLWIEKPHSFSQIRHNDKTIANVIYLDSTFDINVLYPFAGAIVSDYSSVTFDGVYRHIPVIMYTPDLDNYVKGNNGLLYDLESCCAAVITKQPSGISEMLEEINENRYFDNQRRRDFYKRFLEEFWNNSRASYETIWNDIKKKAHISI